MKSPSAKVLIVFVTTGSPREARKIGEMVVARKLAACATMIPGVQSIYRWRGKVVRGREALLMIKTTKSRYRELEQVIRANHSYDTPEIVAVSVTQGLCQYLEWVEGETTH